MKRKRISEILHQVDPELKVVDGGVRHRGKRPMTFDDWRKTGGIYCPKCGREVVRLINGVCPWCYRNIEKKRIDEQEDKAMKRYYRSKLRDGTISLAQMRDGRL